MNTGHSKVPTMNTSVTARTPIVAIVTILLVFAGPSFNIGAEQQQPPTWKSATGKAASWRAATGKDVSGLQEQAAGEVTGQFIEKMIEEVRIDGGGTLYQRFLTLLGLGDYCSTWSGEWRRYCQRHNSMLIDLREKRRQRFDELVWTQSLGSPVYARCLRIANPSCAWNGQRRCEANTPGHLPTLDSNCASTERQRLADQIHNEFTAGWRRLKSQFMRECAQIARREPETPATLPWSCL